MAAGFIFAFDAVVISITLIKLVDTDIRKWTVELTHTADVLASVSRRSLQHSQPGLFQRVIDDPPGRVSTIVVRYFDGSMHAKNVS